MKRSLFPAILLTCGACVAASASAQSPVYDRPIDPHARDLVLLTMWFEGEFDNEEQLWYQADPRSQTPEADRHVRLHTMHQRLDLPRFGEHVFYVEEYKENDPDDLVRQRFVLFSSEGLKGGIRMRQGFFKDPSAARGAQYDPGRLADLSPDDVFFLDECDVFWRRTGDQFEGSMRPKACVFGEGDLRRYSVHNMVLSEDKYWRVDATRLVADDTLHIGHGEDNPTKMRRAVTFVCEIRFVLEDGSAQTIEGLRIHSQGGTQTVTRRDSGQQYTLRMRDKEYPFYDTRPDFLFLSVRPTGARRSLAYAVSDPDARRLGLSAADVLAHCHREGYTFQQPLEAL